MSYETDPKYFTITKPSNWSSLVLYEKVTYYKVLLNEYYAPYVDKLIAKKIIKDLCGDKLKMANVIRILDGPEDLHQDDLNTNHIIKSTHGSGWNINIKENTQLSTSIQKLKEWNKHYSSNNEPQYKYIKPRFFIEEKINDKTHGKNGNADVYMFRCICGNPVIMNINRFNLLNKYDMDFNLLENAKFNIEIPIEEVKKMIEFCKILSKSFEFVRIDFYLDNESNIYFSEFTFSPNNGHKMYANSVEKYYGSLWK